MAEPKKILRRVILTATAIVAVIVAIEAFKIYAFTHEAVHTSTDVAKIREDATRIGGIVLPPSATISKAESHEDFQGGKDLSIVAKIPSTDTDTFIRGSNIQPWLTGQIDEQAGNLRCVAISIEWPGYTVKDKDGWKCLSDHGFDGTSQRDVALRDLKDGTAIVLIKLARL